MKTMLDSGAYTLSKSKDKSLGLEVSKYATFVKKNGHLFDYYFNFDHIDVNNLNKAEASKKSYENWLYLKREGIDTIPVFHVGEEFKWLEKYLKRTDYIALGGIADVRSQNRKVGLRTTWNRYLYNTPNLKVHGMGMTDPNILVEFPWYSADSSSPFLSAAYGGIFIPIERDGKFDFTKLLVYRVSDQHTHNKNDSFLQFSSKLQDVYKKLFRSYGFELGKITYQEKRERKMKHLRRTSKQKSFGVSQIQEGDKKKTLANDYYTRFNWNLTVWNEIAKQVNTDIYVVTSNKSHLKALVTYSNLNCMLSYAHVNNSILQKTKEWCKNESK